MQLESLDFSINLTSRKPSIWLALISSKWPYYITVTLCFSFMTFCVGNFHTISFNWNATDPDWICQAIQSDRIGAFLLPFQDRAYHCLVPFSYERESCRRMCTKPLEQVSSNIIKDDLPLLVTRMKYTTHPNWISLHIFVTIQQKQPNNTFLYNRYIFTTDIPKSVTYTPKTF